MRLDAPLVVATLGGTGTGKSTLVNALVGAEVSSAGRERPTTRQPMLVCRPGLRLAMLGIDPDSVTVIERNAPVLRDLVLLDCPDPDTTEDEALRGTNLAKLRELLPHCDVLLVATTQQKYRSARVTEELAGAAAGARLVFVQTHADVDADVREDWQRALAGDYSTGEMFFVDSLTAIAEARQGIKPRGEFGRLVDLLTRELTVAATHRIRRANFLDLVGESLATCQDRVAGGMAQIEQLEAAIQEQRTRLAARLTERLREELLASRRSWESRLVGEVTSRWGFSPFSCLLRLYQGLGGLVAGAAPVRVRSAAQLALWGALEGGAAGGRAATNVADKRPPRRGQRSAGTNRTCAPAPSSSMATRPRPVSMAASSNRPSSSTKRQPSPAALSAMPRRNCKRSLAGKPKGTAACSPARPTKSCSP